MQRTDQAEIFAENFVGLPLTAECVYRSPKYLDGKTEKEVCDHLLILRNAGIVVSLKCQENPTRRTGGKIQNWTLKQTKKAVSQAKGAIKTIREQNFWCIHRRRGRVDFSPSPFNVKYILILIELLNEVVEFPDEFPLQNEDIPIAYFSANDFYNIVNELRSFPDVLSYFYARTTLPSRAQRTIGSEKSLYSYFILNNESFAGCQGVEDAKIVCAARHAELKDLIGKKIYEDRFTSIIENVCDSLATRYSSYKEGLDEELIALYEDTDKRSKYLEMQNELCDLRLPERRRLGLQFAKMIDAVKKDEKATALSYSVFFVDSKPDFVYILISSKNIPRKNLILHELKFLRSAMAYYKKNRGMTITDRDGAGFEVTLASNFVLTSLDEENGKELFSKLRIFSLPVTLVP